MEHSHWQDRKFLLYIITFVLQFATVSLFSMLSKGQRQVFNAGEDVDLHCEYYMDDFNLFDNPVQWMKVQGHESSEINIMGNIKEPFESTGKFEVSFQQVEPRYMLELKIKNLSLQDTANYSCEVRGPKSRLLGHVTHEIFVRAPVLEVAIFQDNHSHHTDSHKKSTKTLHFIENTPKPLRCIAFGGNPPPDVDITIAGHPITNQFKTELISNFSGKVGFRLLETTTIKWTDKFMASAMDDGKRLTCRVTVPGLGSQTAMARIEVNYAPTIICEPAIAYLGDKNVNLTCTIRARPSVTALFWMLDGNGTVVSAGEVVNEYWTLNRDAGEKGLMTQLFLRQARPDSFRTYTLVGENSVAVTTRNIELKRLYKVSQPKPHTVEGEEHKSQSVSRPQLEQHNGYIFLPSGATSWRPRVPLIILTIFYILIGPK